MAASELFLGVNTGSLVLLSPLGRKFNVSDIQISREDRTASARLVRDIIATKKEFSLRYSAIGGDDLTTYLDFYDLNDELVFRVYTSAIAFVDYTVLMDPMSRQRLLATGEGLWEGFSVVLREV